MKKENPVAVYRSTCRPAVVLESSSRLDEALLAAKKTHDNWLAKQAAENARVAADAQLTAQDLAAGDADAVGADLPSLLARIEAVKCSPFEVKQALSDIAKMIDAARAHHDAYAQRRAEQGLPQPRAFPTTRMGGTIVDAIRAAINTPSMPIDYSHQINLAAGEVRRIALQIAERKQAELDEAERRAKAERIEHDERERRTKNRLAEQLAEQRKNEIARKAEDELIDKYCPLH